ncbi:MAG: cytochrome P450 [Gammaproteobacteria bacterium]|nr:cytochrome P450 [Gammaproteobacteria bacterium]MYE51659.1 cytochrome P450 [Gammaproteobacteria bacterium]MYF52151.1 cytochrome P450 [Gammaproteobacteria bacterium]
MDNPVCPASLDEATLADAEVLECPYPTYSLLREQAPVFQDPRTGIWVITRYEDLRMVCLDTERFSNHRPSNDHEKLTGNARKAYELFQEKGWVPGESLAARDDPEHKQMRSIFDTAFRPKRIKALDGEVETLAYELIDAFIDDGHCNFVKQFAVPLPLIIICRQMGAREEDIWQIKAWTDAWFRGTGFDLSEAEVIWATEMEIQAQHYFQPIFERLRREPDGTLLSDLVNTPVPGWGRTLTDNELHAEMMQDTFVGGSETTTNALSAGIMLLARNPGVWEQLKADPDKYLRTFCEEVVRLESPVQGLTRTAKTDITLHGVTIPKGAVIDARFAAGNRDPAQFKRPDDVDLERRNAASHLGYSSGTHYCLGAPLARRELYWGFKAFIDNVEDFRLTPERNDLRHYPNYGLRALNELHIEFTARSDRRAGDRRASSGRDPVDGIGN